MCSRYLSYNLYYNSDYFETVKYVYPILNPYNLFCVHYKDNIGYHVRIRIRNDNVSFKKKNELLEQLNTNDNIIAIIENTYSPEKDRYGENNIERTESLFELFTKLIYQIISDSDKWKYENSLFASLAVNMVFINSFIDKLFILKSLKDGFQGWLPDALSLTNKDSQLLIKLFEQKFKKSFSSWENLEEVKIFVSENFSGYFSDIKKIFNKIIRQNNDNKLIEITSSIIHMNHNRFGIYNRDESYLFFVLMKLCEKN